MKIRRRIVTVATKPLEVFGDWLNAKMLAARDEFNILTQEMDARSTRARE